MVFLRDSYDIRSICLLIHFKIGLLMRFLLLILVLSCLCPTQPFCCIPIFLRNCPISRFTTSRALESSVTCSPDAAHNEHLVIALDSIAREGTNVFP